MAPAAALAFAADAHEHVDRNHLGPLRRLGNRIDPDGALHVDEVAFALDEEMVVIADIGGFWLLSPQITQLRRLPEFDRSAIDRVVRAAASARVAPAEPDPADLPRTRSVRVWQALSLAAAAALAGFVFGELRPTKIATPGAPTEVATTQMANDSFRPVAASRAALENAPISQEFVLDAPHLYARAGNPYVTSEGVDWPDNGLRFAALSRIAADIGLGAVPAFVPVVGMVCAILYRSDREELRRECPRCGKLVKLHDALCMRCGNELDFPDKAIVSETEEEIARA